MTHKLLGSFLGKWRITDMEGCDADYYDMGGPGVH